MGFILHNFPDGKFAYMGVRFAPALAVFAFRARKSNAHLSVRIALKQKHRSGLLIPTQGQAVGLAPNSRINQNTPGKSRGYLNLYGVCSLLSNMLLVFCAKFPDMQGKYRENVNF